MGRGDLDGETLKGLDLKRTGEIVVGGELLVDRREMGGAGKSGSLGEAAGSGQLDRGGKDDAVVVSSTSTGVGRGADVPGVGALASPGVPVGLLGSDGGDSSDLGADDAPGVGVLAGPSVPVGFLGGEGSVVVSDGQSGDGGRSDPVLLGPGNGRVKATGGNGGGVPVALNAVGHGGGAVPGSLGAGVCGGHGAGDGAPPGGRDAEEGGDGVVASACLGDGLDASGPAPHTRFTTVRDGPVRLERTGAGHWGGAVVHMGLEQST